jgi:hypothetical protein
MVELSLPDGFWCIQSLSEVTDALENRFALVQGQWLGGFVILVEPALNP